MTNRHSKSHFHRLIGIQNSVRLASKTLSFLSPFHSFASNQQPGCKSQSLTWDGSLHDGSSDASRFSLSQCALSRQTPSFFEFRTFTPEAGFFVTSSDRFGSWLFWHQLAAAQCRGL
jgi:hypothetical protein